MANPREALVVIFNKFSKLCPNTAPKIPTKITHTALMAGKPWIDSATAMAMGVVTDLGNTEAAISGVAPIHRATAVPLTMAVILPIKQILIMDFQRARIWCNCSYNGKASATTAGCSKSFNTLLPAK